MNEQYLFIWLSWIFWTLTTFLLPKTKVRTAFTCWVLIILICSATIVSINNYLYVSLAFISFLIGGLVLYGTRHHWIYQLLTILVLMLAHSALLFVMKVSPVIIFLPASVMIVILIVSLSLFFQRKLLDQLTMLILGCCLGELLYGVILNKLYIFYIIGNFVFLSQIMLAIFCLTIVHVLKIIRYRLLMTSHLIKHHEQDYKSKLLMFNDKSL
ncbi:MAG TPA: hypothetical protein VK079_01895 [Bacillota bacterium]|nr:hypothetical protein [Bacillota bacterium]